MCLVHVLSAPRLLQPRARAAWSVCRWELSLPGETRAGVFLRDVTPPGISPSSMLTLLLREDKEASAAAPENSPEGRPSTEDGPGGVTGRDGGQGLLGRVPERPGASRVLRAAAPDAGPQRAGHGAPAHPPPPSAPPVLLPSLPCPSRSVSRGRAV